MEVEKEVYLKINNVLKDITIQYTLFSNISNINIYNDIVCFNLKDLQKEQVINISKVLLNLINKKINEK